MAKPACEYCGTPLIYSCGSWFGPGDTTLCDEGGQHRPAKVDQTDEMEIKARLQIARHTTAEPPRPILDLAIASQHLHAAVGRLTTHQWTDGGVVNDVRRMLEVYAADLMNIIEGELKRRETA